MERKETANADAEGLERLVDDVSQTLQRVLADSPQVAHCLQRIRGEGYEVSLVLEATIGFTRAGGREPAEAASFDVRVEKAGPPRFRMTALDKKFLRSLKIGVDDEQE